MLFPCYIQDPSKQHKYTHQKPWKNPHVLQLKEENDALKRELASKDKRVANVCNRLLGEKDKEIKDLRKEVKTRDERINELEKQLKQGRVQRDLAEQLNLRLDAILKQQSESDIPAEDIPIGDNDIQDVLHRPLSQT